MPRTDLPVADIAGSARARTDADRASCTAIDWRLLGHELRTPLNAILGNTELLLDGSTGPLSTQARACLGEVQTAGRQLLRQVQLLLAWSELCVSRPRLAEDRVDLIALIRDAIGAARPDPIQIEPRDARLLISGDRLWLQRLVAEILALPGASAAPPAIALERRAGRRAVRFAWPGVGAAQTGALQIALIQALARLQGAAALPHADGLSLHWPRQPRASAGALAAAHGAESAGQASAGRCRQAARPSSGRAASCGETESAVEGACRLASTCLL
jgi:hypothetical protein